MKHSAITGREGFKILAVGALAVCLGLAASSRASQTNDQPAVVKTASAPVQKMRVLPLIADVVKMGDAGVPAKVIETFVKNSSSRFALTGDDVVYLQGRGVSTDIINALIEHGASPTPTAPAATQPAVPAPAYATAPAYQAPVVYQQPPTVSSVYIPWSYPSYSYSYYPVYSYPIYYHYPYSYYRYPRYNYFHSPTFFVGSSFGRFNRPFGSFGSHPGGGVNVGVGFRTGGSVHLGGVVGGRIGVSAGVIHARR